MRTTLAAVIAAMLTASGAGAAEKPGQLAHGRYLVENVGMCGDCHTPRGAMGQPDLQHPLGGATLDFRPTVPVPAWAELAPSIAGPKALGWTRAQMVKFLETGVTPDGRESLPPMPRVRLTREDAEAVAAYLSSLPAPMAVTKASAVGQAPKP